jgi:hypothetical protein
VHEPRSDRRQGQDLPGEVDLLDQPGVVDDRPGGGVDRRAEQVPRHQAGEEVEGVVGDVRAEELPEHQPVDHQQAQRPEERPQEPQEGVLVLDLELLGHERPEELAVGPDLADGREEPPEERLRGVDPDERRHRRSVIGGNSQVVAPESVG